jgi:release factor glutamine methyltransferase
MIVKDWLSSATKKLKEHQISTARLDALVLLEDTTKKDRAWLLAHEETIILPSDILILDYLLKQRVSHTPLAYIRGTTEFYNRKFVITPAVLVPRPESETIIEELKLLSNDPSTRLVKPSILDVGTGSGVLAITAKLELKDALVDAIDIDCKTLKVAQTNVDLFTLKIKLMQSDLLSKVTDNYQVLLCNLPYVPDDLALNRAAMHEPRSALFGGNDGLDLYRKLFHQIKDIEFKPLYILTEAIPIQHSSLLEIASESGYKQLRVNDFIQVFKKCFR